MPLSKHIFIWTLVILVGVIFGVGPSVGDAFTQPRPKIEGTDIQEKEAVARLNVVQRLHRILGVWLGPTSGWGQPNADLGAFARDILTARYADSLDLMPDGKELERLRTEFLDTKLRDGTYRSAIEEYRLNREGNVTVAEIDRLLAERYSRHALYARHVHQPVAPLAVAPQVARVFGAQMPGAMEGMRGASIPPDQIEIDQATLDASPFLAKVEIAADDPELRRTFEALRNSLDESVRSRFVRPAVAVVNAAYADMAALTAAALPQVTTAEIEAYYNANKDRFAEAPKPDETPAEPPKEGEPAKPPRETTYKPLEAVTEEIRTTIARTKASDAAAAAVTAFVDSDEALALDGQDAAAFTAAAAKAGLSVATVEVEQPRAGPFVLQGIGTLEQDERQLGLFSHDPGFISGAARTQATGDVPCTWVVLRLDQRREVERRELEEPEVLDFVTRRVKASRAYADFLAAAETLRAEAEAKGQGGLRAILESDAGKAAWPGAVVASVTRRAMEQILPPPPVLGGVTDEEDGQPLISLALPTHPVALTQPQFPSDEVPTVMIVQAAAYKPATPPVGAQNEDLALRYRGFIINFATETFADDLQRRIAE
ncbi:MAG TPA: hypothetical protein VEL07_04845 [Planctomycetota bacterium]|nr:hypothetical protein [Planctomycetota bacterium]